MANPIIDQIDIDGNPVELADSYARSILAQMYDKIYPIGSIYMSVNSTNPKNLFGGTWERITGRFLLAATDRGATGGNSNASIAAGGTGGEASHTLTPGETASKSHQHTVPNHAHTLTGGGCTVANHSAANCNRQGSLALNDHPETQTAKGSVQNTAKTTTDWESSHTHGHPNGSPYSFMTAVKTYLDKKGKVTGRGAPDIKNASGNTLSGTGRRFSYQDHTVNATTKAETRGDFGNQERTGAGSSHQHGMAHGHGLNHPYVPVLKHSVSSYPTIKTPELPHTVTYTRPTCISSGTCTTTNGPSNANGSAHNNMPPYLSVYVWKRIA